MVSRCLTYDVTGTSFDETAFREEVQKLEAWKNEVDEGMQDAVDSMAESLASAVATLEAAARAIRLQDQRQP
jgi:hypothetical protein